MKSKKRILILVPDLKKPGGVANFYSTLKPFWGKSVIYFTRGARLNSGTLKKLLTSVTDVLYFIVKIISFRPSLIIVNSSFGLIGFVRDSVFIAICRLLNKDFIVFFRGWDGKFEKKINKGLMKKVFNNSFLKAKKIIVLARDFENVLKQQGYNGKIFIETTSVDNSLLQNFNIEDSITRKTSKSAKNVLFLSRMEKSKGIYEAINTVQLLNDEGYKITLSVAGDGSILEEVKSYVEKNDLHFISFLGYVKTEEKVNAFSNADYYIFPSIHSEGMPNSVLEAMSFGLPLLVNKIGGIPDFFTPEMGIMTNVPNPREYSDYLLSLLNNQKDYDKISRFNHNYAIQNFLASNVSKRILEIAT